MTICTAVCSTRGGPPASQPGPNPGEYGFPLDRLRNLVHRWLDFDWRSWEKRLNAYPQYRTEIDGQQVHFLHVRSAEAGALPVILSHGWPGSVFEYLELIGRLTDPVALRRTARVTPSTSSCRPFPATDSPARHCSRDGARGASPVPGPS